MNHNQRRQGAFWGMLFNSGADILEVAIRQGDIKFADQALLWALASRVKPSSGRVELRLVTLARRVGVTPASLRNQMQRLRRADLVRLGEYDNGGEFWMIHPDLFCTGGEDARRGRKKTWASLPRYTPRRRSGAPAMALQAA